MTNWKIKCVTTELDEFGRPWYWSNEFGWTWKENADSFSDVEKESLNLPVEGIWEINND